MTSSRRMLAVVVATSALASCGGDGQADEEKQLRADVTEALTTKDPVSCTRDVTQRFAEQLSGLRGEAAVRRCRAKAVKTDTTSVRFDRVAISGARASATVRPGGDNGVKTVELKLRSSDGRWKLDRLSGGTVARKAFYRQTRKELRSPPVPLSRGAADCVVRHLERTEDDDLVRGVLTDAPSLVVVPVLTCLILNDISDRREHRGYVRCVERRMRRELTVGATGRRIAARRVGLDVLETAAFGRAADRIVGGCAR